MFALAESLTYRQLGFVNEPDKDDPKHFMWSVQMKSKVTVAVFISDIDLDPTQCQIHFDSKVLKYL